MKFKPLAVSVILTPFKWFSFSSCGLGQYNRLMCYYILPGFRVNIFFFCVMCRGVRFFFLFVFLESGNNLINWLRQTDVFVHFQYRHSALLHASFSSASTQQIGNVFLFFFFLFLSPPSSSLSLLLSLYVCDVPPLML